MAPAFHLNTLLHPSHVTVGAQGPGHRTSLRSVMDYLGNPYLTSHHGPRDSYNEHVFSPNFDIRETADAYYLEGEFPSVRDRDSIFIESLGSRGLLIEARIKKLDLGREWDIDSHFADGTSEVWAAETVEGKDSKVGKDLEAGGQAAGLKVHDRLSERPVGCLQRSFTFPEPLDYKNLKARLKDGLLRVRVPKMAGGSGTDRIAIEFDEPHACRSYALQLVLDPLFIGAVYPV